jgi:hypothetical protein
VNAEQLDFYRTPGRMSVMPDDVLAAFGEGLPADVDGLRRLVQQLLVHRDWAPAYGLQGDDVRMEEQHLRSTAEILCRAMELSPSLSADRPAAARVLCVCRHYALVYTALLRHRGVPARVRCGFANYFDRSKWLDHWITERWAPDGGGRWVRDDPQVDGLQRKVAGIDFDTTDQPPGQFLSGAEAWIAARAGEVDPSVFGIFDMWGLPFIRGNVVADVACLNKVELLPWDGWGMIGGPFEPVPDGDAAVLDEVAGLVVADDVDAVRRRYLDDDRFRVPPLITSFQDGRPVEVQLPL